MIAIDIESFPGWWLMMWLDETSGRVGSVEIDGDGACLDAAGRTAVRSVMESGVTLSFNGLGYDLPLISAALMGATAGRLKALSDEIVGSGLPAWKIVRRHGIVVPSGWDHVDIMDVAPGTGSLKLYAGRLGLRSVADLPFPPNRPVEPESRALVRAYCEGDLRNTLALRDALAGQVALRETLGARYGMDLRSRSDASIAEAVMLAEIGRLGGSASSRADRDLVRRPFHLARPDCIRFRRPDLSALLEELLAVEFAPNAFGLVRLPADMEGRLVRFGSMSCRIGVGGLHSTEERRTLRGDGAAPLVDLDVASYYPAIILQQRLSPPGTGGAFQTAYADIVRRRLEAKAAGDRVVADSLKIVVNATFGKTGSVHSPLCSPPVFMQVVMTGQLALLMLVERMEEAGLTVVSANTDGVVVRPGEGGMADLDAVSWGWELDTGFELERTEYAVLAQRDVNSYVAVTTGGKVKRKGAFAAPSLSKNAHFPIVADAVAAQVALGTPVRETVEGRRDPAAFCAMRRVTGGAEWRGEPLGRVARWHLSTDVPAREHIRYVRGGAAVPQTGGARPCMVLPDELPEDLDVTAYVRMAKRALDGMGWFGSGELFPRESAA